MEGNTLRGDKRLRRLVLVGFFGLVAVGVLILWLFTGYMDQVRFLSGSDPKGAVEKLKSLIFTLRVVNAAVSIPFSAYFFHIAMKTLISGRYPPEGMRLFKDTTIQEGLRARIIGLALIFMALLLLSTNLVTWYLQVILQNFTIG